MSKSLRLALGYSLYVSMVAGAAAQPGVVGENRGREFALTLCADCHLVASDQPRRPMHAQQIPSFAVIANRPGTTSESLHKFVRGTHSSMTQPGNMPVMNATDYQLDQIVNYILSLRRNR